MEQIALERPCALTIAGLDPSGGAGLLADVKTFEQLGVYGLGACTALTYQTDVEFKGLRWISTEEIASQLQPLLERYHVSAIKIGLIQDLDTLSVLLKFVRELPHEVKIVWDPVLAATAGYVFHNRFGKEALQDVLQNVSLITPNCAEALQLAPADNAQESARQLSRYCPTLLSGLQLPGNEICDFLFVDEEKQVLHRGPSLSTEKHGSGCIFSSAITGVLTKDLALDEACLFAGRYVRSVLSSNRSRLGFHSALQESL